MRRIERSRSQFCRRSHISRAKKHFSSNSSLCSFSFLLVSRFVYLRINNIDNFLDSAVPTPCSMINKQSHENLWIHCHVGESSSFRFKIKTKLKTYIKIERYSLRIYFLLIHLLHPSEQNAHTTEPIGAHFFGRRWRRQKLNVMQSKVVVVSRFIPTTQEKKSKQ